MNRKQKMIYKMWKNYSYNCKKQKTNPLYKYEIFRNVYISEEYDMVYSAKNWYRNVRI